MDPRRLLVGPDRTALHVGLPVFLGTFVLTAASTTLILRGNSGGGVFFPLDALAIGVAVSAIYAARYRAVVVCIAIGIAAFAGSTVGFHAVHGDDAVLQVLARFASDMEPVSIGAVVGAVGGGAGSVLGYVVTELSHRFG